MSLFEQYREIVQLANQRVRNEQQTKDWVIRPVLEVVLGYHKLEIVPEVSGPGNTRPDYTILPDTPHTWLLEAKAWSEALSDQHAVQATGYAYQNGKQWVVLSNGREWRLYDSFVTSGGVADRLVLRATQDEPEAMEALFQALQRETVVAGRLEVELARYLLVQFLRDELQRDDSDCVAALRNVARKRARFEKTTGSDIVKALARVFSPTPEPAVAVAEHGADEEACEPAAPPSDGEGVSLDQAGIVTGTKPAAVIFPDGERLSVASWKEVWTKVFCYAAKHGTRPVPLPWAPPRSKMYWVNVSATGGEGRNMREPSKVQVGERLLYVETHASAAALISLAVRFCGEMGIDPSTIRVVYH